jgi:D-alanyl-D-alanine carboxypeptidase
MKGWLVGLALATVLVASGAGLWITWDDTQTSTAGLGETRANALVTTTAGPVTTTTAPAPPECGSGEVVEVDPGDDWATTIIDPSHRLSADYQPDDLVDATEAGFESRDQVRAVIVEDLAALRAAAEANGTPIAIISGYRSHPYQQGLFDSRVASVGEEAAALSTARPGHSEHQLGTAVDVLEPGVGELTAAFADTPAGQWVAEHAHEYGFVISYPEGATEVTCYEFEPWHLRYVGRENAAAVVESGLPLREWLFDRAADAGSSG